jgi:hypothetical protein
MHPTLPERTCSAAYWVIRRARCRLMGAGWPKEEKISPAQWFSPPRGLERTTEGIAGARRVLAEHDEREGGVLEVF